MHTGRRGKVLIVDDNADNLSLAEQILEDNYQIITADNGQSCIDLAMRESPDVIILDVQMPGMDGYEVLQKMTAMEECKNIPVILFSARYRDVDRVIRGLELGAFDYITKPVDDDLLHAKVRVAMRIKRAEDLVRLQTKDLYVANEYLQTFAYSASHDLRAPLRHINSYSQALVEDYSKELPSEAQFMLQRISASALHMGVLIEGLLNFSRASVMEVNKVDINMSKIVEQELQKLKITEPERLVKATIAENINVQADASALQVILSNLLSNAWKYTKNNAHAVIEFGMQGNTNPVTYFIRDNGAGFNMELSHKLYKPFSRLHNQEEFTGHGIGLATVHSIIEKHGGQIWAESKVAEGATFFFTLGS